jgi:hypothetical protein
VAELENGLGTRCGGGSTKRKMTAQTRAAGAMLPVDRAIAVGRFFNDQAGSIA